MKSPNFIWFLLIFFAITLGFENTELEAEYNETKIEHQRNKKICKFCLIF